MLILILINVQYLQIVIFSFEKRFEWLKAILLRLPSTNKIITPPPSKQLFTVTLFKKPWMLFKGGSNPR